MPDDEVARRKLTPTDDFEIVQHIELLDMPIHVTEHQLREYLAPDGKTVVTRVPELEGRPIPGPRMLAMIGWLKSRAHCSYTTIAIWMSDIPQLPACRGYLAKLHNGVISDSLSDSHEEFKAAIPEQETLGSDIHRVSHRGFSRSQGDRGTDRHGFRGSRSFRVHPADAYVDLKKRGRVGPICSCIKDFRQETPTCPQACCTMRSGFVTTAT